MNPRFDPNFEEITMSAGARFRAALEAQRPLQIVGTINAYTALLAERAGHKAIYLSGAGVANAMLPWVLNRSSFNNSLIRMNLAR